MMGWVRGMEWASLRNSSVGVGVRIDAGVEIAVGMGSCCVICDCGVTLLLELTDIR